MPESDALKLGQASVSKIFRDEAKLKQFLKEVKESGINLDTSSFSQVESFIREIAPPGSAIPARGGRSVMSFQDLADDENEVLQQCFKQELKNAKAKHRDLF